MSRIRRPLLVAAALLTSLVTACADPMAPAAAPRHAGIAASASAQSDTTVSGTGTSSSSSSGSRKKSQGHPADGGKSGYNVTAY